VIVADTSAWTELFRRTGSVVDRTLRHLLHRPSNLAVTEVVVMELLAGARSPTHYRDLRELLLTFRLLRVRGLDGYEHAAELYRLCRAGGETVRSMTDCLVAVPAIEAGAQVLHADRDFDKLARHTPLQVVSLDG
jgi:predicted nucleic acid-binding protein